MISITGVDHGEISRGFEVPVSPSSISCGYAQRGPSVQCVQARDIGDTPRACRVYRDLEGAREVQFQILLTPDAGNVMPGHQNALALLEMAGQRPRRPVREPGIRRWGHPRRGDYPGPHPRRHLHPRPAPALVHQLSNTPLGITGLAAIHRQRCHPGEFGDVLVPPPLADHNTIRARSATTTGTSRESTNCRSSAICSEERSVPESTIKDTSGSTIRITGH